jgi:hypothetical protein
LRQTVQLFEPNEFKRRSVNAATGPAIAAAVVNAETHFLVSNSAYTTLPSTAERPPTAASAIMRAARIGADRTRRNSA